MRHRLLAIAATAALSAAAHAQSTDACVEPAAPDGASMWASPELPACLFGGRDCEEADMAVYDAAHDQLVADLNAYMGEIKIYAEAAKTYAQCVVDQTNKDYEAAVKAYNGARE